MNNHIKYIIESYFDINKILNNYDNIKLSQIHKLNESFFNTTGYIKETKTLTESAIQSNRTRDYIYISHKPIPVLYETSLYNQKTQYTAPVLDRIMQECNLTLEQISVYTQIDDQEIADAVMFYLPGDWSKPDIDSTFNKIDKIMSACGYFLSTTPEYSVSKEYGKEYIIQYEPNIPEYIRLQLPEKLHHITSVKNSIEIQENGFIPKTNDVYNYAPRIYFSESINGSLIRHICRRYGKELLDSKTNKPMYADITINTPHNIKFYFDIHMKDINSYFTFDKIDKTYVDNIEIKNVGSLMTQLYESYFI